MSIKAEVGIDDIQRITLPQGCSVTVTPDGVVHLSAEGETARVSIEVRDGVAQIIGSATVERSVLTVLKLTIPLVHKLAPVTPGGDERENDASTADAAVSLDDPGSAAGAEESDGEPRAAAPLTSEDPATAAARHAETIDTTPAHRALFVQFVAWVADRPSTKPHTGLSEEPALRQRIAMAMWVNLWRTIDAATAIEKFGGQDGVFFGHLANLPADYVDLALDWARATTLHNPRTDADQIRQLAQKRGVDAA